MKRFGNGGGMNSAPIKDNRPYVYTLDDKGIVFYVGKGTGDRVYHHEREARNHPERKSEKLEIIRKVWANGREVGRTILAYFSTVEDAYEYEGALIFLMPGLANKCLWASGIRHVVRNEQWCRRIGEANKKRVWLEESRRKLSEINQHSAERLNTPEQLKKRSEDSKGKKLPPELVRRRGEKLKGRVFSEEHCRKISDAKKNSPSVQAHIRQLSEDNKGRKHSDEFCQKQCDIAKKRWASGGFRKKGAAL